MDGFVKTTEKKEIEEEISFKNFFIPFTPPKAILWIVVVGLIVYFNVLFNGFVADDIPFIVSDPSVHTFNIFSLFGINTFNSDGYYRPIPAVYFSLLWNLFGNLPFFYHFSQIILHIVTTSVLIYFLKRFFNIKLAFFLSLIFLIHPIQTESVAVIGATQSELFSLFGLSSLLLSTRDNIDKRQKIIIFILALLSLLTKETGFLFLILIILYQVLFKPQRVLNFVYYSISTLGIYAIIRFLLAQVYLMKITTTPIGMLPLSERLMNIPAIIFYYLKTFFYPAKLAIDQQWSVTSLNLQQFYIPIISDILFFLLLVIGGWFIYKKNKKQFKLYLFFFVWLIIGIVFLLQIFPLDFTISDRWFYFPIVGLISLFGIILQNLKLKNNYRKILIGTAILCIVLFSVRSIVRNSNYIDEKTLYIHDASNSYQLENLLGNMYLQENNFNEATVHYLNSIAIWPCSDAHNNLGYLYQTKGNLDAAEQEYVKAIKCEYSEKAYGNLVVLLYKEHKYNLDGQYANEAIQKYPKNGGFYFILGVLEAKRGDREDALVNLNTGYQLSNDPAIKNAIEQLNNNKPVSFQ